MSRRSLETSTPAKSRAVVFVVVGSKSFLLCHSRPVLADTGSPRLRTKGYRQLFGLSLLVLNGKGATTWRLLRGLDGPGPRSVCRAHPADFTTANKIQGPGLLRPGPCVATAKTRAHLSDAQCQRILLLHLFYPATTCSTPMPRTRLWDRVYC